MQHIAVAKIEAKMNPIPCVHIGRTGEPPNHIECDGVWGSYAPHPTRMFQNLSVLQTFGLQTEMKALVTPTMF